MHLRGRLLVSFAVQAASRRVGDGGGKSVLGTHATRQNERRRAPVLIPKTCSFSSEVVVQFQQISNRAMQWPSDRHHAELLDNTVRPLDGWW